MTPFPRLTEHALCERLAPGHAAGITVVTPNQRLALALQRDFDAYQRARGRQIWETADILPFGAYLERVWQDALHSNPDTDSLQLLTPAQEQALWEEVLHRSPLAETVLAYPAAAAQCRDAWQLAQAWRLTGQLKTEACNDDVRAFLEWAGDYENDTRARGYTDAARLADVVASRLPALASRGARTLVLFGFDILTPQRRELILAMAGRGLEILTSRAAGRSSTVRRLSFSCAKEEIFSAASWARARLEEGTANVRIGIVVPDLAQSRSLVQRTLLAVMQPRHLLPDGVRPLPEQCAWPFNLSLGVPLTDYPLVHDALLVLQLAGPRIAFNEASRLLRSPFLAAADTEMAARARLDAAVRERAGVTLTLERLLRLVALEGAPSSPALRERFSRLAQFRHSDLLGVKTATQWARLFSQALNIVGFPGERTLDSSEYQTLKKWHEALTGLAALEGVTEKMGYTEACRRLRRLASETLFQPQAPDVPIQVLGVLESAGLAFDHLWVTGLTDEAWPLPARPNPFIPLRLQRAAGVPHADAASSLELDRQITAGWLTAAGEVIVSHARRREDSELAPSALIGALAAGNFADLGLSRIDTLRESIQRTGRIEHLADDRGPRLATRMQQGGTAIFKDQAACPFRAFARHRLESSPLETPLPGLDAIDRGTLLHHALAALWTALESKARLDAIEAAPLEQLLNACAQEALAQVHRYRPDALTGRFAAIERGRLVGALRAWLALEKRRGDFTVVAIERKLPVEFGGVAVNAKLDRMDRLGGGHAVIDYKTGACAVSAWLGPRPEEPQLPMYALGAEEEIVAVAFAQLKAGDLRFRGLASAEGLLPGVTLVSKDRSKLAKNYSDWSALVSDWRVELEALGRGFAAGDARVDPKRGDETCRQCDQQLLCRIAEKFPSLAQSAEGEADE